MKLTDHEKSMLAGREGKARQKRSICSCVMDSAGAERFLDTKNVAGVPARPPVSENTTKPEPATTRFFRSSIWIPTTRRLPQALVHTSICRVAPIPTIGRLGHEARDLQGARTASICRGQRRGNPEACTPTCRNVPAKVSIALDGIVPGVLQLGDGAGPTRGTEARAPQC